MSPILLRNKKKSVKCLVFFQYSGSVHSKRTLAFRHLVIENWLNVLILKNLGIIVVNRETSRVQIVQTLKLPLIF